MAFKFDFDFLTLKHVKHFDINVDLKVIYIASYNVHILESMSCRVSSFLIQCSKVYDR